MPVTRHETTPSNNNGDLWAQIAAPVPASIVQWRQNGKGKARDGKYLAPFVAYIDAQFVRERLDMVVPGEWDLTLEPLPMLMANSDGEALDEPVAFKARLTILSVIREDVGAGRDYKTASTDAFKRAAVRFGIAHELYTDYEIIWVQVDGDGKYARALEEPSEVFARKRGIAAVRPVVQQAVAEGKARDVSEPQTAPNAAPATDEPSCPKCGGRMWDNRLSKKNPRAPDHKCRSRSCDGVIWPPRSEPDDVTSQELPAGPFADERDLPF